ncbi:MAG: hypothetical protein KGD68_12935 [Candidatus Lokiarchaeota archaeon]|nr:hypothetical protein [Candidatus Lokiarchaeota archaeon]
MATTKNIDKSKSLERIPLVDPYYHCEICGSNDIVETQEGFTCRACGIVLEVQRLEYHRPYDADLVQHAVLSKTQIGFKSERRKLQYSAKLEGLSRIDASRSTEENVVVTAKVEIKRILTALTFSLNDLDTILSKFKENRAKLGKGTKYRSAEMLVPCVIYAYYKENNKPIRESELLEVAKISKKDFNAFKFSIIRIWPEYQERDRKQYITERILEVCEHFKLGMSFYYQSRRILNRFYDSIKNTKDDVIVGLVSSITLLCSQQGNVSISALCDRLGIKMSTIHRQVERRVIQKFNVPGFKSLVKSAELLKDVMEKLGVLDQCFVDPIEASKKSPEIDDIVQITLGNASQVFNSLNGSDTHFLFVKEASGYFVTSITNKQDNLNANQKLNLKEFYNSNQNEIYDDQEQVKVELWRYYNPKGPPVLC